MHRHLRIFFLLIALVLFPLTAAADVTGLYIATTIGTSSNQQQLAFQLRVRDKNNFVVTSDLGGNMVAKGRHYVLVRDKSKNLFRLTQDVIDKMIAKSKASENKVGEAVQPVVPKVKLKPLDGRENVAGIEGRLYEVEVVDALGKKKTVQAVLSDHPAAMQLHAAMVRITLEQRKMMKELGGVSAINPFEEIVEIRDLAVLRYGDVMKYGFIDDGKVEDKYFAVPPVLPTQ